MSRLILVKHAMPTIVETRPAAEWELSEEGRIATCDLAEDLRGFMPATIVASTEPKAEGTARTLAETLGAPMSVDAGLVEHRRPEVDWVGREVMEARIRAFFERPAELVFGAETADAAHDRFAAAVERHRTQGTLIVVAHGTVITLWVSRRCPIDAFAFWKSLTLPSAVVIENEAEPRLITV